MSTISAGTSNTTSLVYTGDTTGNLAFQINGTTEAMRITTGGNVGIGTTTPNFSLGGGLQIKNSVFSSVRVSALTNTGVDFSQYLTGDGYLYNRDNSGLVFGTNNIARMRINAGAPILCLDGGNTDATGTGIAFPATQNASADANTLDDYEEGTWTPAFIGTSSNPTVSYNFRFGTYVKIGRMVALSCRMRTMTVSGGGGDALIGNLPFTADSGTSYYVSTGPMYMFNTATSKYPNTGRLDGGTNYIQMFYGSYNVASNALQCSDLGTGSYANEMAITIVYQVA